MRLFRFFSLLVILLVIAYGLAPNPNDLKKTIQHNNQVLNAVGETTLNQNEAPITADQQPQKTYPEIQRGVPEAWMGAKTAPTECINKQRSLGNGIIKCQNGYFRESLQ